MAMRYDEAVDVLQEHEWAMESYSECEAEAGMGGVSMGFDGYDSMAVYRQTNPPPTADAEWMARVREAQDVIAANPAPIPA